MRSLVIDGATPCSGFSPEHRVIKEVDDQQMRVEGKEDVLKSPQHGAVWRSSRLHWRPQ